MSGAASMSWTVPPAAVRILRRLAAHGHPECCYGRTVSWPGTSRLAVLAIALALLTCAATAVAKHPPAPSADGAALRDGCQRSDIPIGLVTSPEWVYVYRDPKIRRASGIARVSHVSNEDDPLIHDWSDFNSNLVVDRGYSWMLGGSRARHTGNYAGHVSDEVGRLHFEWEMSTFPTFAWPWDGDRTTLWGSWIWDCGHWTVSPNNLPGAKVTGETTELHPLDAIVVNRSDPYRARRGESETDAFISNAGTAAHAEQQCALTHHPADSTTYDSGYRNCARDRANFRQPLLRSYSFFVPAPRRPSASTRLTFRAVTMVHPSLGRERIRVERGGLAITVTLPRRAGAIRYGKSFFVSWAGAPAPAPTRLKVTLRTLVIHHADPSPSNPDKTPPKWNLFLAVNGDWKLVNDWVPGLARAHDGERFKINRSLTLTVPRGGRVLFQLAGRECDIPTHTTVFGLFIPLLRPCAPNPDEINSNVYLLLHNDDTGTVLDVYRSAAAALGVHTRRGRAVFAMPGTGRMTFGDDETEGNGNYSVTYSISRG